VRKTDVRRKREILSYRQINTSSKSLDNLWATTVEGGQEYVGCATEEAGRCNELKDMGARLQRRGGATCYALPNILHRQNLERSTFRR